MAAPAFFVLEACASARLDSPLSRSGFCHTTDGLLPGSLNWKFYRCVSLDEDDESFALGQNCSKAQEAAKGSSPNSRLGLRFRLG
jgi:hypothetical protein